MFSKRTLPVFDVPFRTTMPKISDPDECLMIIRMTKKKEKNLYDGIKFPNVKD